MQKHFLWVAFLCLSLVACSPKYGEKRQDVSASEPVAPPEEGAMAEMRPSTYYDFADILVPREMKLDPDSSLLFETTNLKAGRICFKGWVDPVSLFDFFMENMPKDNWKLRSYFKYGVYLLVFEKPDRDCIVSIHKGTLSTRLEVWVTPRMSQPPAK
jgi:hypothetical protein